MKNGFLVVMFLFSVFVITFLLIESAFATNEFGKITSGGNLLITDVDVRIDSLTSRNLEFGDTITKVAKPSSKVEFQIEIKNNHSSLDMTDLEMVIAIDDLDLEKTKTLSSLGNNNDKTLSVEFDIPSDADEDDYEILIEAEGELNNTIHRIEFELNLEVEISEEEQELSSPSVTTKLKDIDESVSNLSKEIGSYFNPYATCVSERDSLKETIKTRDTTITNLQGYESKFTTCNTNLLTCNTEKEQKAYANESCHYSIKNQYEPKIKSQQNWTILGILATGVGFMIYMQFQKKKEKQGTESEEPPPPEEEAT